MKKVALLLVVLVSSFNGAFSQNDHTQKSSRVRPENKSIGLSNLTSDTITIKQLRYCYEVTLLSEQPEVIVFYRIGYTFNDSDYKEGVSWNNELDSEFIEDIIDSDAEKIEVYDVMIASFKEDIPIGYRIFYLDRNREH